MSHMLVCPLGSEDLESWQKAEMRLLLRLTERRQQIFARREECEKLVKQRQREPQKETKMAKVFGSLDHYQFVTRARSSLEKVCIPPDQS